tara:strand:+ start:1607 stop:2122 length:516 start_codon:yes stop_codon:yes gene_type:complete
MAQEFTIKSQKIEDKINQLLPSQGGAQPGVDFSASTMVIPIVDLTETAEGSDVRPDLQTALSHKTVTHTTASASTVTAVNTTGYYSVTATYFGRSSGCNGFIFINDGFTSKNVREYSSETSGADFSTTPVIDSFVVKLEAGDSLGVTTNAFTVIELFTRQIADINGNLIDP